MHVLRARYPRVAEFWFGEPVSGVDVALLRQAPSVPSGVKAEAFETLHIDLAQSPDQLLANVHPDTRYDIRRATGKDGLTTRHFASPAADELGAFAQFYSEFASSRGLGSPTVQSLEQRGAMGQLQLSNVEREGVIQAWHAYVVAFGRARLLYSATHPLAVSTAKDRAALGRANRLLHWQDILTFKEQGLKTYDLGGIPPEGDAGGLDGIRRFKLGFGGVAVTEWDATHALTPMGKAYLWSLKLRPSAAGKGAG